MTSRTTKIVTLPEPANSCKSPDQPSHHIYCTQEAGKGPKDKEDLLVQVALFMTVLAGQGTPKKVLASGAEHELLKRA